ncbi:hypothetical protein ACQB60_13830 [Actinomycetota bacterium Odt1-20B]
MAAHETSRTPSHETQPAAPAPLTAAWLSAHFDSLPFPARMTALARYARTLTPAAYATLHGALDGGSPDERHTALFLAVVRRDLDTVAAALTDPLLRRRALSAARRLPVPEQALERLALSDSGAARRETYRILRLSRRRPLAARLLPLVHERFGARDAALLLPACPEQTVTDWLSRIEPAQGVLNTLARTAPTAVAETLTRRRPGHRDRHRFRRRHQAVASLAAERDPRAGLLLLERGPELLTRRAARSVLRRPAQALEILRAAPVASDGSARELPLPAGPLPPSVRRAVQELPLDDRVDLARRCPVGPRAIGGTRHDVAPDGLLMLLPAPQRRQLIEERTARVHRVRSLPTSTLTALAPADRAQLVRPWVKRWARQEWTMTRLAAVLPLPDGEPLLREETEHHRRHHRELAWPALLACAELHGDPAEFARIALHCERAWHDQDEVRHSALRQLASAPPRLLMALPERVLRDVAVTTVQSRDSTAPTLAAAERLLRRTAQSAAARGEGARAAYATALLCEITSDPRFRGPVTPLRTDTETARAIWDAAPSRVRERPDLSTPFAELLAPCLGDIPDLDSLVRRTAREHEDPQLAARAAAAWVAPARLREQRCAELIATDASFATVPIVLRTVAARRTDLLEPVLAAAPAGLTGRTRPRPTPWAQPLPHTARGRWLPAQRQAWDEHHARVATDELAPLRTRADAAAQLRDAELLMTLADTAPQPVAAAALAALGDTAGAPGDTATTPVTAGPLLDALLRHAAGGGVRGRAAMASVRHLLEGLTDQEAVRLLGPVARRTDAPVGTRKEAVRALGVLHEEAAFDALLAAWDAPGQHRDVRAVVARFLVPCITHSDVADRLARQAHEPAIREAVLHTRGGAVPDSAARAYRDFLTHLAKDGDDDTAAAACRVLTAWLTRASEAAMNAVADLAVDQRRSRRVWDAAARQLVWFPRGPATAAVLQRVFDELVALGGAADRQVAADALRRLATLPDGLRVQEGPVSSLPIADALGLSLRRAGLLPEAARLTWETALAAVHHGEHDARRWERLLALVEERPERLALGQDPYLHIPGPHAREALLRAVRMLRERDTAPSGALAVTLVRAGGRATGWPDVWRAELAALCAHSNADTAMAAFLVDPDAAH